MIDIRHVTIHMNSASDTQRALSRDSNKIKNCLFRLFRWSTNFKIGKDSSMAAVWVKLFNLPLQFYNESSLMRLGYVIGTILRVCPTTSNLTQQKYIRLCIKIDVSNPLMESFLMGTSKEYNWPVYLEYEGNNAYCTH